VSYPVLESAGEVTSCSTRVLLMGRPPKFTEDALLDAALTIVAQDGAAATTAAIATAAGAKPGSLYYRFPNREVLLLTLWVRSIRRFQAVFLAAARSSADPDEALVAAAVTIPRYCREHPGEAQALRLFRYKEVLRRLDAGEGELTVCPAELREAVRGLNDEVYKMFSELTWRRFGTLDRLELVRLAVHQTAYGLVRPFLGPGSEPMPCWLDDMVAAMVPHALAVGDRPGGLLEDPVSPPPHAR
jgi:putative transcriptional regulator